MSETKLKYADQNITEINRNEIPDELPIIPLRNAVVLPGVLLPIFVGRTDSMALVEEIGKPGTLVGLFAQKSPADEDVNDEEELYRTGSLAEIHKVVPVSEGGYQVFMQGVQKIELIRFISQKPYLRARIAPLGELSSINEEEMAELNAHVSKYVEQHPAIPDEVNTFVRTIKNASALANQVIFFAPMTVKEKVEFLQISSVNEKVEFAKNYLIDEMSRMRMEKEVREKVEKDATQIQREFYLRKQMETIRKELGEEGEDEAEELEKQLSEKDLPEYMHKAVNKELKRFKSAIDGPHSGGMEAGQIRNWLELVLELPWADPKPRHIDLKQAATILDEDHEGLDEVKKRIIEFLAVEKHTGGGKAPILCLVGPPGVGKTSLATSIGRAMNRPLVRAALGGMRDEAEIRGHRRTYIGALPGKILNAMKKAETLDPVFLLDEIDKTGASYQGDPAAALLEVLDPEQNHSFEDHYLGHPYNLQRVLFIATANNADAIPRPLLDRMELVQLSGYTLAEKKAIAIRHLLPTILKDLKFDAEQLQLTDEAVEKIITAHTRESGVRSLKRKLESIARKAVRSIIERQESEASEEKIQPDQNSALSKETISYDTDDIVELLGRDRFTRDAKEESRIPGVAVGLAWTPVGGDILFIETAAYPGKGQLRLSGQLGDVMKESAQAAFSFLRAHAQELGIEAKQFTEHDIHIHVPSGAIPKDGPSAGVTMLSALTSLLSACPTEANIAMTGEISLRGRILPVGGIKEKVLAARAAGIQTVLLPEKNRAEYEEIPEHVTEGLDVEYYADMMELLRRTVPTCNAKYNREQAATVSELGTSAIRDNW